MSVNCNHTRGPIDLRQLASDDEDSSVYDSDNEKAILAFLNPNRELRLRLERVSIPGGNVVEDEGYDEVGAEDDDNDKDKDDQEDGEDDVNHDGKDHEERNDTLVDENSDDSELDESDVEDDVNRDKDHEEPVDAVDDNSEDEDLDDRLDDEDFDLLEENLGVKVKRRRFKRLKRMSSDSEDVDVEEETNKKKRAKISKPPPSLSPQPIFEDSDKEPDPVVESGADSDDSENFIVDENDQPLSRRIAASPPPCDATVLEAIDTFGQPDYTDVPGRVVEVSDDDEEREESDSDEEDYSDEGRSPARNTRRRRAIGNLTNDNLDQNELTEAQRLVKTDLPERYQLRRFPLTETAADLDQEAGWIFERAFATKLLKVAVTTHSSNPLPVPPVTATATDDNWEDDVDVKPATASTPKPPEPSTSTSSPSVDKSDYLSRITKIIKFIRDFKLEVPYIFFYQKDIVRPVFTIEDLWTIYSLDEEFCRIRVRQQKLVELFAKMKAYQRTLGPAYMDRNDIRVITNQDLELIHSTQSLPELDDIQGLFILYYGDDVPKMKEVIQARAKELERLEKEAGLSLDLAPEPSVVIQPRSSAGAYRICRRNGIGKVLPLLGLSAEEFGENCEAQRVLNETDQSEVGLKAMFKELLNERLKDEGMVATAVKHMQAIQFSKDIRVRKIVRNMFLKEATISVSPTRKGMFDIDENHPVFPMKFLKNKPVSEMNELDFLELTEAEKSRLITMTIGDSFVGRKDSGVDFVQEVKSYFKADSDEDVADGLVVEEWNNFRGAIVELTFEKFMFPEFRKEVRFHLLKKATDTVKQRCADKIFALVKDRPYSVTYEKDNDFGDWDTSKGLRVMAFAYEDDVPISGVVVDKSGYVVSSIVVTNMMIRPDRRMKDDQTVSTRAQDQSEAKNSDKDRLLELIDETKPHVIVIGGESRGALNLIEEVNSVLGTFPEWEINFKLIPVIVIDNEMSKVYARSGVSTREFPGTTEYFRQAVSLCRYVQDPFAEVAQLYNSDEDILSIHLNKHQCHVSKEELLRVTEMELMTRACEVGIDLNEVAILKHRSNGVQFLAGFGPHKADELMRGLREGNRIRAIVNRKELLDEYGIGPVVYKNMAGFVRIRDYLPEDAQVDPRDQTRIHPQHYGHALIVARGGLQEENDTDEELTDAEIIEKVMVEQTCQNNLMALDLGPYLNQLKTKGLPDMTLLFETIIAEFLNPYGEVRKVFEVPCAEELFYILTNETAETVRENKLITVYLNDARFRKPSFDEMVQHIAPEIDPFTKANICTICTGEFETAQEFWLHYDLDKCPGTLYAIHVRVGNGITGLISVENFADRVPKQKEIMKLISMRVPIQVRVRGVDVNRFFLDCTARTSDLQNVALMPQKDPYYDFEAEKRRFCSEVKRPLVQNPSGFFPRNIAHPSYKNVTFMEAENLLKGMDDGDVIFRPSTKGFDVLGLTWKVPPGHIQHLNILEKNKRTNYELGTSLTIGSKVFEDLDEIIAMYVNPQASFCRDIVGHKHFKPEDYGENPVGAEDWLRARRETRMKSYYVITASKKVALRFTFSYMYEADDKMGQETMGVGPGGIWFFQRAHPSIEQCVEAWKVKGKADAILKAAAILKLMPLPPVVIETTAVLPDTVPPEEVTCPPNSNPVKVEQCPDPEVVNGEVDVELDL